VVRAIGLMTETSMDAVDVAIIETDGQESVTLGRTGFFPYSETDPFCIGQIGVSLFRSATAQLLLKD
jgi:hypothetical protein